MTQYSQTAVAIYIQQAGRNVRLEFIDTHRVFQLLIAELKIEPMKNYLLKNLEGSIFAWLYGRLFGRSDVVAVAIVLMLLWPMKISKL